MPEPRVGLMRYIFAQRQLKCYYFEGFLVLEAIKCTVKFVILRKSWFNLITGKSEIAIQWISHQTLQKVGQVQQPEQIM